jgi:hypothetical protein
MGKGRVAADRDGVARRHWEEQRDEAIQLSYRGEGSWIASLRSQ